MMGTRALHLTLELSLIENLISSEIEIIFHLPQSHLMYLRTYGLYLRQKHGHQVVGMTTSRS